MLWKRRRNRKHVRTVTEESEVLSRDAHAHSTNAKDERVSSYSCIWVLVLDAFMQSPVSYIRPSLSSDINALEKMRGTWLILNNLGMHVIKGQNCYLANWYHRRPCQASLCFHFSPFCKRASWPRKTVFTNVREYNVKVLNLLKINFVGQNLTSFSVWPLFAFALLCLVCIVIELKI